MFCCQRKIRLLHNFEEDYFETNRIDAVSMERLTSSRHIVNMYGFCGMSVTTEYASGNFKSLVDAAPPISKLKIARDIAIALAAVHGIYSDGSSGRNVTLVHNDINPSNIIVVDNDVVKLNDFNVGVLKTWNQREHRPCRFLNIHPSSQVSRNG